MAADIGLTHVALQVSNPDASVAFYEKYAAMRVVHRRVDQPSGHTVVWLSDHTRPFVIVLIEQPAIDAPLRPISHLGVGCVSREEVDRLCAEARREGCLHSGPTDSGYPIGYWAFLSDRDGNTLEISYGQEVALTVAHSS
ncbi:MAG TPA: VOC family protein [Candidatus Binataceae bacterium]|nr:VOC family protein [Candidatus Binataceae bacterium]